MPVVFRTHRLYAIKDAFLIEDAFTAYAAFAGILDTIFDSLYTASGVTVTGTNHPWLVQNLPASFLVRYHKTSLAQGIVLGSDSHQWRIMTNGSGYPEVYYNDVLVQSIPVGTPTNADVIVAFRQMQMSDDESDIWVALSLWMNDRWITSYTVRRTELLQTLKFGLVGNATYTTIRIPELCDYAEYGTLDPGEASYGGLNRAIEGRYLRFFLRPTGELRAWKVKPIHAALTVPDRSDYQEQPSTDLRGLMSRVRMMGAYTWAEDFNADLVMRYGDRFQEVNNPMLLTVEECAQEAHKTLIRAQEQAFTDAITLPFLPFLEPEDRIETESGSWVVSEQQFEFQSGAIDHSITARAYVWGEPS